MNEELLAELAAMRRLIEKLHHDIARLGRQADIIEQTAQDRPPEDGDGMLMRRGRYVIDHGRGRVRRDDDDGSD